MELSNVSAEARQLEAHCQASRHRSVYLPMLRGLAPRSLAVFDFAEQGMVTGSRDSTTVAPQALYLLNDPFAVAQSQAFAQRLLGGAEANDAERIDGAYRLALCRPATAAEIDRGSRFLAEYAAAAREQGLLEPDATSAAWASYCQALFASAEFRFLR